MRVRVRVRLRLRLRLRVDGVGTTPLCTLVAGPLVGVQVARLHGVCMVYAWCVHGIGGIGSGSKGRGVIREGGG